MISLSGYGQTGPWRDFTAYGMGLEPASGISSITGYRDGDPLRTGISFTDPYSGVVGAGAVLAALHYRRRTGKGQYIDLSEHESAIPVVGHALMDFALNQRNAAAHRQPQPLVRPAGLLPLRGRRQLARHHRPRRRRVGRLLRTRPATREWAQDERFADVLGRFENHDALDELISTWTREQDQTEAMHLLQDAGVIAAAVLNPKQALLDPHLRERGFYQTFEQPDSGPRPAPPPARRALLRLRDRQQAPARRSSASTTARSSRACSA